MKDKIIDGLQEAKEWLSIAENKNTVFILIFMFLVLVLVFSSFYIYHLHQINIALEKRKDELKSQFEAEIETEIEEQLSAFFDSLTTDEEYEVRKMNITKYAPLDPEAVDGWDYMGVPEITASGKEVIPGKTAAAGPNIPFGTRIYVEGKGWYTVNDRGGKIGTDDIDLAADSKEETRAWGVQERLVIIEKPEKAAQIK